MKKISAILVLLLALLIIQLPQLPWKSWAHQMAIHELAKRNIHADFTIEEMGVGRLVLSGITIKNVEVTFDRFEVEYEPHALLQKKLVVKNAVLRSAEGVVKTGGITYDFSHPVSTPMTLQVSRLPLGSLMKLLTGGQADASGMASGTLSLTVHEDGRIAIRNGAFAADRNGTITVPPTLIPGDNEQVAMVRAVLADFHYQDFSMELEGGEHDKLSMLLKLYGNNPDAYNGREVKLNVRLQGDLLSLVQQSVTTISNPEKLLEQNSDEKK